LRLIPAIDIQGGRCVRLRKGVFTDETVFSDDPVGMAEHWVAEGGRHLHVVDLDGAREGEPRNFPLIRSIAETVAIPVQTGGGIRSEAALRLIAESRVAKAVLGTSAVEDQTFVRQALDVLGATRLVVAIDAEQGMVKTRGWQTQSDVRVLDLAARLKSMGVIEVLYTDIARDGMMQSVDLSGIRELAAGSGLEVIASGGVSTLDDLRRLKELEPLGVTGVIVGRALYEGSFTVGEALAVLEG
jgi:phosphoribosylformimino-5-aminoimidazole carboxamide ribotide isomerase